MSYSQPERDEIAADLESMYRVGRIKIPQGAEALAEVTTRLNSIIDQVNSRAAQIGDPTIAQNVISVGVEVHNALTRALTTLNDVAAGIVYVADDFVARDATAREVFDGLSSGLTTGPVGQADVPTPLDEEQLLHPGDGDDYAAVPDVRPPDEELADLNDDLDDVTGDTSEVDDIEGIVR